MTSTFFWVLTKRIANTEWVKVLAINVKNINIHASLLQYQNAKKRNFSYNGIRNAYGKVLRLCAILTKKK